MTFSLSLRGRLRKPAAFLLPVAFVAATAYSKTPASAQASPTLSLSAGKGSFTFTAQDTQVVQPAVRLSEVSRKSFDAVFAAISDQAHVTIVAEGVPLHPVLSDPQLTALGASLPAGRPVGAKDAVSAAADAFDYKAEPVGPNLYLLHKRYTDPADLPCVTYDEIVYSLRNLLKVTDLYDPRTPTMGKGSAAELLAAALSPEQLSKPYLEMNDLDPEQRRLAIMASEQIGIQNKSTNLKDLLEHLLRLKKPGSVFQWMTINSDTVFGYGVRSTMGQYTHRYPVTGGYVIQVGGSSKEGSTKITWSINARPDLIVPQDPKNSAAARTVPADEDRRLAPGMLANRLPSTRTLAEAIAEEFPPRQSAGAASKTAPRPMADSAIAEKPVSLFGPSHCSGEQFLKALCSIYGLEVRADKSDTPTLTMRRPRPVNTIADLPKEARRLVPEPLLHALDGQSEALVGGEPVNKKAEARLSGIDRDIFLANQERTRVANARNKAALEYYYYPSIRRLVALAEPAVPLPSSPPAAITDVNPEACRLIAIAQLTGGPLNSLEQFCEPLPLYLSDPDGLAVHVQVVPDPTRHMLIVTCGHKGEDGAFAPEAGSIWTRAPDP